MEAVENLVVSEEADSQIVVDESFMQSVVNSREDILRGLNIGICLGQHLLQTLVLLRTVGKDIETIAMGRIVGDRLYEQVHILVE